VDAKNFIWRPKGNLNGGMAVANVVVAHAIGIQVAAHFCLQIRFRDSGDTAGVCWKWTERIIISAACKCVDAEKQIGTVVWLSVRI
jgi:hypothetical protein